MSFLGGPECSTAGNPLTQFTKHIQDDKSLQRDRLAAGRMGSQFEGMRTMGPDGQSEQVRRFRVWPWEREGWNSKGVLTCWTNQR